MPVLVVDAVRNPLLPCHPAVARKLLASGKATVLRRAPFTILLKRAVDAPVARSLRLKIDPGSRVTGLAVLDERTDVVLLAAEIEHRGQRIKAALHARRTRRRDRRHRKTRYRAPRFDNRRQPEEGLPPSLTSRVANVETWVDRLCRLAPIGAISLEWVKFDMRALQNPEVRGVAYQQGELAGYEVREYLLEKWQRHCVYCGAQGVPLQVEHIRPKAAGGTDRVSNLTLACEKCNEAKGATPVEVFLAKKPELLRKILAQAEAPLTGAACVNATRWELLRRLRGAGLPVETGTGGRTKFNRVRLGLPKTHWLDAVCVGASTPERLQVKGVRPLMVKAMGHGHRRHCLPDRFGFPRGHAARQKRYWGFQTGDLVRANVPKGKYAGTHLGRVAVRRSGSFCVGKADGISWRHCSILQCGDGYDYAEGKEMSALFPVAEATGPRADEC